MSDATLGHVQRQQQIVFESKGCVYRIPAVFYERESKTILALAEQRKNANDNSAEKLVIKRGEVKEDTPNVKTIEWSELQPIEKALPRGYRTMNPCPLYDEKYKTLFLFFICVEGKVREDWQIKKCENKARLCYVTSTDLGKTWNELIDLSNMLAEIEGLATFAVGPGHGLQTEQGRLIVPLYVYVRETKAYCCLPKSFCVHTVPHALSLYSDDSGENWQFGQKLQAETCECGMAECFDDKGSSFIYCNARTKGGYREEHVSENCGHKFRKLESAKKLVETGEGCQGSLVSFPAQNDDPERDPSQNKWLLFSHPSKKCCRRNLGVYLNEKPSDPGAWSKPWVINNGPSGYSDLAYIGDSWFACLMESGKMEETEQITSVVFSYSEVKQHIEVKRRKKSCFYQM